ncbi:3-carboxy-cis,cis-muconate cycloisomerase [Chromobacterium haemolyticum]|uniref:3-carboxy-cis,cis-muconate cycloisomerase n=1 Tax=Chromobacterium fluminis TaxID=3044269 RepID=A0ABX0LF03_9NEIS|nr:3-carboxy-cis,cis-muconate cycloisomerase [Chromobacterium haemolyticum]NHR08211.1 3-carboxy-cis,cis-muconate cycloisomerase [Chromobacterium haemolyticum]
MELLNSLFRPGVGPQAFTPEATIQALLDVEAALARAEADVGVILPATAEAIAAHCRVERIDLPRLAADAAQAGNLAIPLVRQLTALVAADDAVAAGFVHWGATSQDILDTALVLQLRRALAGIAADLDSLIELCAERCAQHRGEIMAGRTWLQQAPPITLGLKLASLLDALLRQRERLRQLRPRLLTLQLGGAVGTLAALAPHGLAVMEQMARRLDLAAPDLPWHSQRDRLAELACWSALLCGTLGKLGRDVSLSAQTEIAELREPEQPGRGGSSSMPHKRNPVACAVMLAAAARAPGLAATLLTALVQEQERGLGGWQAEWETLPDLLCLSAGALRQAEELLRGLVVDSDAMRRNLEASRGLIMAEAVTMALGQRLGHARAHLLVAECCEQVRRQGSRLADALLGHPELISLLNEDALHTLLDPDKNLGAADALIERVLRHYREQTDG